MARRGRTRTPGWTRAVASSVIACASSSRSSRASRWIGRNVATPSSGVSSSNRPSPHAASAALATSSAGASARRHRYIASPTSSTRCAGVARSGCRHRASESAGSRGQRVVHPRRAGQVVGLHPQPTRPLGGRRRAMAASRTASASSCRLVASRAPPSSRAAARRRRDSAATAAPSGGGDGSRRPASRVAGPARAGAGRGGVGVLGQARVSRSAARPVAASHGRSAAERRPAITRDPRRAAREQVHRDRSATHRGHPDPKRPPWANPRSSDGRSS